MIRLTTRPVLRTGLVIGLVLASPRPVHAADAFTMRAADRPRISAHVFGPCRRRYGWRD